ncbi:MAG: hypothetical protein KUG82_15465 [Pseudomonadales bacterium]|nr:hypothetical protein [Pseudomonadales bacterium]
MNASTFFNNGFNAASLPSSLFNDKTHILKIFFILFTLALAGCGSSSNDNDSGESSEQHSSLTPGLFLKTAHDDLKIMNRVNKNQSN